ncbi:hypothetical protein QCA50_012830 [Cerrena zonata]|uniref:Uncharacterized protein n=1 Tax=Cerrena zonata TaxID=2478898 RepID=A0AAW0FYM1_9APHY
MNRPLLKEDIQKYIQRWQQLKTQYGDQAVNIPEFNQISKVIRIVQSQYLRQKQQQQQQQQQQQGPLGQGQGQGQGQVQPPQQFQQQGQMPLNQNGSQLQSGQQFPMQLNNGGVPNNNSNINGNSMMTPNIGNANVNLMSHVPNNVSGIPTPQGNQGVQQSPAPSHGSPQTAPFPQPTGSSINQPPQQMFQHNYPSNSNLASATNNSTPTSASFNYVPPAESPFSTQQIQLFRAQNLALKYLFKNNGSYNQIPPGVIDMATNERMAFPDTAYNNQNMNSQSQPTSQPPSHASGSPVVGMQQPPTQPQSQLFNQQQQQGIPQQARSNFPSQSPVEPSKKLPAGKRPSKSKTPVSNPNQKRTPSIPNKNTLEPIVMKEAPPQNIKDVVPDKEKNNKVIVPISKPSLQVNTFEVPEFVGENIKDIPFNSFYVPQSRVQYPGVLPEGFDINNIMNNKETLLLLEIEFEKDALRAKLQSVSDDEKERIEAELTKLELLPLQKIMKGKVLSQIWFSKSLLPNSHPNFLAKFNSLSIENISATQDLYQQQLFSLVQAQNKRHQSAISKIISHKATRHEKIISRKEKLEKFGNKINSFHAQIAKEEQKKVERMAKQRLQALKSNDEEAYLKLLDHTKDTRITHLLNQTNQFLDSLAQAVQTQQKESHEKMSQGGRGFQEVEQPEFASEEERREKTDYYHVAHRIKEEVTKQPSILIGGTLKEYQIKGLQWMVSLFNNHLNGILADEMGLGKTIQTISLLTYLVEMKKISGPFLVIVPLSTLTNWNIEFDKWAPSLKKITYKGTPNQRKVMQNDIKIGNFQVLLTTFEYIIKDRNLLSKVKWVHMIIDEGHRMKNAQSKLSETLTHHYHSDYRLILTGTPLQNNLPELWALLNFALPKIFNSVKSFDEWFNTPFANTGGQDKIELSEEETLLVIRRLHKVLRPFLLRRLKKDVEKDLPNKVERVVKCKMSALQSKLYQQMLKYNILFAGTGDKPVTIKNANNQIMQLRKICNHPFVYEEVENLINPTVETNDQIWRVAGKFELLDKVLPKFKQTGHRVLIFFQMTQIMDIMEDFLRLRGLKYMRLDGGTKSDDRTGLLKLFNAPDSDYFCFLLSTRAGGLGLNLQTADTVIIFDTDWNPHQDLQAQDRAHRIGQKNEVRILRLITEDSVEEMILERAHAKLEIDGKVIQAGKFDNKSTAEEQEALLRALLEKEEERRQKGNVEEEEDLDDDELNQVIARNDGELDTFRKLDEERAAATRQASYSSRLFTDPELPEIYKKDPESLLNTDAKIIQEYGRGTRERKTATYDDHLTEEQWLKQIDGVVSDSDDEENKPKRTRGRPKTKKADDDLDQDVDLNNEGNESIASTKRKALLDDDNYDYSEPVPTKRQRSSTPKGPPTRGRGSRRGKGRGGRGLGQRATPTIDPLTPEERASLQSRMESILDLIMNHTGEDGRRLSDLFLVKPSKRYYPDYYVLIKHPIALDTIKKRISSRTYTGIRELLEDVHLMFSNARIYNEEGSIVYQDATILESLAINHYRELSSDASPEEVTRTLDFTDFDEIYSLKPLVIPPVAVKQPLEQPLDNLDTNESMTGSLISSGVGIDDSTPFGID